ncbi:MAG: hypothetical protein BroJett014_20690 [Planctomycetota bacterium]|nr:MAG: hypothetical protein BroJett014_20690 [Planctomycetota bacterium]
MFLARPGYNGNRHMEAVVVDSTANSIVVEDLTGDLFEALGPEGRPIAGFVTEVTMRQGDSSPRPIEKIRLASTHPC